MLIFDVIDMLMVSHTTSFTTESRGNIDCFIHLSILYGIFVLCRCDLYNPYNYMGISHNSITLLRIHDERYWLLISTKKSSNL